jgi:hypothetical protein
MLTYRQFTSISKAKIGERNQQNLLTDRTGNDGKQTFVKLHTNPSFLSFFFLRKKGERNEGERGMKWI